MIKEKILRFDNYDNDGTDMSVTDINRGIKEIILNKRHQGWGSTVSLTPIELESNIQAALGRAWDMYVERVFRDDPEMQGHMRLYFPVHYKGKRYIISGEIDLYHIPSATIIDNKCVKLGKIRRLSNDASEYYNQLNGYAWLMQKGYTDRACTKRCTLPVRGLMLCAAGRDWDEFTNQASIEEFNIPLFPVEETQLKFLKKLKLIIDQEGKDEVDVPYCSADERWEYPPTFPVFKLNKDGSEKAKPQALPNTKDFKSPAEAESFIAGHKDAKLLYWKLRGGVPSKCISHCKFSGRLCDYISKHHSSSSPIEEEYEI